MKQKQLLRTLLAAVCLLVGTSAWGETTTLLEHGTKAAPWTAERLATWTNVGATLTFDSESTPTYVQYSQSPRGAFSSTQTISPTTNAIINVEAVWRARSNTGRYFSKPCGIYFRFGNIVVAQNDQDQKHGYTFSGLTDMANVTTFTAGSYRADVSSLPWLKISMEINTATNTLTSFSVKSEDGNTTYASASNVSLSNPDYTTVSFGWIDTDVKIAKQEQLKSVKITQTTQDVVVSGYTIKFQDASGNTLKDDITSRTGVVGTVIPVTDSDKADFYTGEGDSRKKWTYASDDSGEDANKIAKDGSTVVIVKFNEVDKYSYSVTTKAGETELPYSYAGSQFKGETVEIPYPRYQLQSGTLYTKAATSNEYNYSFTLNSDNQEETITGYSDSEIENVVFYTEGEDIAGATRHTSTGAISYRSSASAVGTSDGALTIMNGLPVGKYKIVAAFYKNNSGNVSTSFTIGSSVVNVSTNTSNTNLQEATSDEFVVSNTSDVVWAGTGLLDYVYIQKTGERFDVGEDIITNGSFATNTDGWTLVNYKRNPTAGQNSTPVVESWDNAGRDAGSVTQSVGYLPTGNYVISASVLSGAESYLKVLNASDDSEIASIECTGSWYDKTVAKSFTLNEVKDVKVQFSTPAQAEGTWWSYVTNVSLIYYGSNTPVESKMAVSAPNKAKYGTFYAPYDVEIPTLIKAYTAQNNAAGTALTLTEINGTIPAYTPVILENNRGNDNAFNGTFYGITTEGTPASSALTGTLEVYTLQKGNYIMQYQNNETAFYLVSGDAVGKTIAANRCYIAAGQNAKAVNVIYLDSETTAINNVNAVEASMPVKRIVNGQLVIEKDGKQYNAMGQEK